MLQHSLTVVQRPERPRHPPRHQAACDSTSRLRRAEKRSDSWWLHAARGRARRTKKAMHVYQKERKSAVDGRAGVCVEGGTE